MSSLIVNRSKMMRLSDSLTETEIIADGSHLITNGDKPPDIMNQERLGRENSWVAAVQMFISFLVAGFGMVAASLLLDAVQHWQVFNKVSEVYILVPALLGLKGNLEMTLASRLSTHAHLGHLKTHLTSLVIDVKQS